MLPATIDHIGDDHTLTDAATAFHGSPPLPLEPSTPALEVLQGEVALVRRSAPRYVGSNDATTCVVVAAVSDTHALVTHVDSPSCQEQLAEMMGKLGGGPVVLHACGGYAPSTPDEATKSRENVRAVLTAAAACGAEVTLGVFAVLSHNTSDGDAPLHTGCVLDTDTGTLHHGTFACEAPHRTLRSSRWLGACDGLQICWDASESCVVVPPFPYDALPPGFNAAIQALDDATLLTHFSTSPEAEPPHFCDCVRASFAFVAAHPDWREVFPGEAALRCALPP